MPKIAMLNQEGAKVGEIELSEAIFASEINESVLHLVVRSQLAAKRQGTQSARRSSPTAASCLRRSRATMS